MGQVMQRSFTRRYGHWDPYVSGTPAAYPLHNGALVLGGPAGPVSLGGTDRWNLGMDPSDPRTWVRPYNPRPGMMALFNFDPFLNGEPPQFNTGTGLTTNSRPKRNAVDRRKKSKRWGEP
jgi:hypothetical protein